MKLSIIIPVYNAAGTLESMLDSLSGQLCQGVEMVIVDDGSTDATPEILSRFASARETICRVVRQENAGAAAARNTAIEAAQGEYLAFADADDCMADTAIETILESVETGTPDILGWDWLSVADGKARRFFQADYATAADALRNLMGGTMKWNLWLFAVKRSLVMDHRIRFLEGADMGEDMAFMLKCFASAGNVKQIHEALYRYNASNPASISRQMSERRRAEVSRNLVSAERFLSESDYKDLSECYLPHLKLYIKLPLLISDDSRNYDLWYSWFPEANAHAMENKALPFRTRLLQGLASRRMHWAVKLYNLLVYKLVYGILYH